MAPNLVSERKFQRRLWGLLSERPHALPGQALVLTGKGGTTVLYPDRAATTGEVVWGGYDTIYEVDMGNQDLAFACNAPANGGDVSFHITFSCGYRVADPAAVVHQRIEDPTTLLQRVLTETMSRITAGFDIEKGPDALKAVRSAIEAGEFADVLPLHLYAINVSLELDNQAKAFLQKRREARQQVTLARESTDLTVATAEAAKLRQDYELKAQQRQREHELELQREKVKHELAMQKLRIEVYKPMIEGGMMNMLVQHLAQNPDDTGRVAEMMLQAQNQKAQTDLLMLKALLDGDIIEDRHLKDVTASLVRNLEQNLCGASLLSGGPADTRQLADKSTVARDTAGSTGESAPGK